MESFVWGSAGGSLEKIAMIQKHLGKQKFFMQFLYEVEECGS